MTQQPKTGSGCFIGIDLGTTTTRTWLIVDGSPVYRLMDTAGARDTASDGNNSLIKTTLRAMIAQQQSKAAELGLEPGFVSGAGMLTSGLGLAEIPHLHGPVGKDALQKGVVQHAFSEVTSLPVLLIPGVRTGVRGMETWDAGTLDLMRGEETLCVGLLEAGILQPGATVLNLGSHWKAILIDDEKRIAKSFTDLSGELMYAAQNHTVLASAVPREWPSHFEPEWVLHGVHAERSLGLSRALYSVRILELGGKTTDLQRVSYLAGSFIAHTLAQLLAQSLIRDCAVLCGAAGIVEAWKLVLKEHAIAAEDRSEDTEAAFIRGLTEISLQAMDRLAAQGNAVHPHHL